MEILRKGVNKCPWSLLKTKNSKYNWQAFSKKKIISKV